MLSFAVTKFQRSWDPTVHVLGKFTGFHQRWEKICSLNKHWNACNKSECIVDLIGQATQDYDGEDYDGEGSRIKILPHLAIKSRKYLSSNWVPYPAWLLGDLRALSQLVLNWVWESHQAIAF